MTGAARPRAPGGARSGRAAIVQVKGAVMENSKPSDSRNYSVKLFRLYPERWNYQGVPGRPVAGERARWHAVLSLEVNGNE